MSHIDWDKEAESENFLFDEWCRVLLTRRGSQAIPTCVTELASCCGAEGMPLQFWITVPCESRQPLFLPG